MCMLLSMPKKVSPTYYAVGWCNRVCLQQVSVKKKGWINRRKERVKDRWIDENLFTVL